MKRSFIKKTTFTHPLARFVTKEAIAQHLGIKPEKIYKIDGWPYVIHVTGKKTSIFVSYADLPPILGVSSPTQKDYIKWRKRLKTRRTNYVPNFWEVFYCREIERSKSMTKLLNWENLISQLRNLISQESLQEIDLALAKQKARLESR